MKKLLRSEKGFSLIELLIVIGILMILATIIIPRFSTSTDDTKIAADAANVKLLQSAIERYHFDKDKYPVDTDGGDLPASGNTKNITQSLLINNGYINEEATDPWKAGRVYKIDSNGVVEVLGSKTTDEEGS